LPELRAAFDGRFDIGIVPREHEDALARRFGVQRWPSLVLLREGGYLGTVSGMQDWTAYLESIGRTLDADVVRAPGIGIPVVSAGTGGCH
jgi:hydrogenase-1 operon protein HyaE